MTMRPLAPLLLLLLTPGPARAAGSLNMGTAVLQMGWALLVVTGLILLVAWLVRSRFTFVQGRPGQIRIKEIRPLANRASLALVEVRGRTLLIGISQDRITLLSEGIDPEPENQDFDQVLNETP